MALDVTTARNRVKDLADVSASDTSFDTDIDNYVQTAIDNLYPFALNEVAPDTSKTFAADSRSVTLPTGVVDVRRLELYDSATSDYSPTRNFITHAGSIYLDEAVSVSTQAKIWGWGRHTISSVPAELYLVVFYWAVAQFYAALAGNKRKYNLYIANTAASADRDMKDSADYFEQKGNTLLADRTKLAGGG